MARRKEIAGHQSGASLFSSKIACGECGNFYGSKVWHSNSKYRRTIWQCNSKFKNKEKCKTPHLNENTIKQEFIKAVNNLIENKEEVIKDCEALILNLIDTTSLDKEIKMLQKECEMLIGLTRSLISENASKSIDQNDYNKKYEIYANKYEEMKKNLLNAEKKKQELKVQR